MNKINILYDATIIARGYKNGPFRTGLFFAALRILEELAKDERFAITLFVQEERYTAYNLKIDNFLSQFPLCISTKDEFQFILCKNREDIRTADTAVKKIYHGLRLLKKYLSRISHRDINKSSLKSIHAYLSPMYTPPPVIAKLPGIKHFIVLHDTISIIFPQYFPDILSNTYWFNRMIASLNIETCYFCNSESTKKDFLHYFGSRMDERKMIVIHHAPSQNLQPIHDRERLKNTLQKYHIKYNINHKYLYSFCTLEPRKNLPFTICCFVKFIKKHSIDDLFFYLGGSQWDGFIHQMEKECEDLHEYSDKITLLGYVNDEDVNILYSNSLFFTYISEYEGFGVPPIEAMQAGTPVITSNNSSLPEVVGDAAIMIDYNNEEQCIRAFEDLYFNEILRKEYINKGLERAKRFSWEKTVDQMTETIIKSLC